MENEIIDAIYDNGAFDGIYFEKFLNKPIHLNDYGKEIVRVFVDNNDEVMAHILDANDETEFVSFKSFSKEVQTKVYADIFGYKIYDIDEFFEYVKNYLEDGDKLVVSCETNEKDGHEYMIYSMYNSCDGLMGEYHTLTHLYKKF